MTWVAATTGLDRADFVDRESVSAVPLAKVTGTIADGDSSGVIDMRRWQNLQIYGQIDVVGRTMIVQCIWSEDVLGAFTTGTAAYTCLNPCEIIDSIPNQGPYVTVIVSFVPPIASAGYVSIMGRNNPGIDGSGTSIGGNDTQVLLSQPFFALAAATQIIANANFVQRGTATFVSRADQNTPFGVAVGVYAEVQELSLSGLWTTTIAGHFHVGAALTYITNRISVGSHQIRLAMTNNTAAAINVVGTIILSPT